MESPLQIESKKYPKYIKSEIPISKASLCLQADKASARECHRFLLVVGQSSHPYVHPTFFISLSTVPSQVSLRGAAVGSLLEGGNLNPARLLIKSQ